jgi:hypothetical protein
MVSPFGILDRAWKPNHWLDGGSWWTGCWSYMP